jgi:hypothetical protein
VATGNSSMSSFSSHVSRMQKTEAEEDGGRGANTVISRA